MSRLLSLLGAVAALLFVVPSASAFEITVDPIEGLPELGPGETHAHQFNVNMVSTASQNIICAQDSTLTVSLAATKADPSLGLGATVDPATVTFTIPTGAYLGGAGSTWSGTAASSTLNIDIGESLPPGHTTHTFGVKASYDGTVPPNCQGDFPGASDEADATVPLKPPVPEETPTPTQAGETPTDEPDDTSEESPAPGGLFVVLAVALVALLRRR